MGRGEENGWLRTHLLRWCLLPKRAGSTLPVAYEDEVPGTLAEGPDGDLWFCPCSSGTEHPTMVLTRAACLLWKPQGPALIVWAYS